MTQGGGPQLLEQCPALRGLGEVGRTALWPFLVERHFGIDRLLCEKGKEPDGLFIVEKGEVGISFPRRIRGWRGEMVFTRGHIVGEAAFEPEAPELEVRAITDCRVRFLPRSKDPKAPMRIPPEVATKVPELAQALRALADLRLMLADLIPAIRNFEPLRFVSARAVAALVAEASVVHLAEDDVLVRQGEDPKGLYYLFEGQLKVMRRDLSEETGKAQSINPGSNGEGPGIVVDLHYPPALVAGVALSSGHEPSTIRAMTASTLAYLPLSSFNKLMDTSEEFARSCQFPRSSPVRSGKRRQIIFLVSNIAAKRLGPLNDLLADAIGSDHGHNALVVDVRSEPAAIAQPADHPRPVAGRGKNGVYHLAVVVRNPENAAQEVRSALERLDEYPHVLLQLDHATEEIVASLKPLVSKVVFLTDDTFRNLPRPYTVLQDVPIVYSLRLGSRPRHAEPAYRHATVRLKLDLDQIAAIPPDKLTLKHQPDLKETMYRWVRAITDRRVGVALGGGGSWGFAHVKLLERMHEKGLPIDMVSGSSFGSMVGAYYCVKKKKGLDLLFDRGSETNFATRASFVSSLFISRLVNKDLDSALLENLEVPLLPVATDVSSGREHVVSLGTVGYGVRASGSFAGLFTPTTGDGFRYIDGGFIDNVPVNALIREGVDLVVGSEIVPSPTPIRPPKLPWSDNRWVRPIFEFDPIGRIKDMVRGSLILVHSAGNNAADLADELFQSDPVDHAPWDFTNGKDIASQAAERVEEVVERVLTRWRRMSCFDTGEKE